jgi:ADP-dependent phosphofructokinase/glucokinase
MKILCGYNVNVDSIYRISGVEISELLGNFEMTEILGKIDKPPGKIFSKSDFMAGLVYCMKNGYGGEWLIFEQAVFEFLKTRYFEKSLLKMGGNAGIMANTLSQLGADKVIPNVAVPSRIQLSLFSKKSIYFPPLLLQRKNGSGTEPAGDMDIVSSNQDAIHFVFDFSEGDTFSLYGTQIRVPRENRFIATYDHLNFRLFVNPAFEKYACEHACEIDGALISGFHLLLETYTDGSSYKRIMGEALCHIRRWKALNYKLRVSLEFGHFTNKEIASSVFLEFASICDSIGMNEDELAMLRHFHGVHEKGLLHMEAEAVANATFRLASQYGLKKLIIHTREFVLTAFKQNSEPNFKSIPERSVDFQVSRKLVDFEGLSLQKIARQKIETLMFGVSCAGAYANSGRLEGREFVDEEASKLQGSAIGREQLDIFLKAFKGQAFDKGAYAFKGEYILCMLPTLLSKFPVTTVGLGDTFMAGIFLRELELDVQA